MISDPSANPESKGTGLEGLFQALPQTPLLVLGLILAEKSNHICRDFILKMCPFAAKTIKCGAQYAQFAMLRPEYENVFNVPMSGIQGIPQTVTYF